MSPSKAKAQEIEEQQVYKPGRKHMREIKEAVTDELPPRADHRRVPYEDGDDFAPCVWVQKL